MEQAKTQVEEALSSIDMGMPVDFVATDLRSAWELLGDITGDIIEHFENVDKVRARDRVTADTDTGRLTETRPPVFRHRKREA